MAVNYNNKIVTNGLSFYLDARNTKSYPGSGTTWTDLSLGKYSSTLVNSPTFSNSEFAFNGTNNRVTATSFASATTIISNFTYTFWCRPTATISTASESTSGISGVSGQKYVIKPYHGGATNGGAGVSVGTNGVGVFEHGDSYLPCLLFSSTSISNTVQTNITIVYVNKQPRLYINGSIVRYGLTSAKTNIYGYTDWFGQGDYGYFSGAIASIAVYNRSLSDAEVMQNFQAHRGRYGV